MCNFIRKKLNFIREKGPLSILEKNAENWNGKQFNTKEKSAKPHETHQPNVILRTKLSPLIYSVKDGIYRYSFFKDFAKTLKTGIFQPKITLFAKHNFVVSKFCAYLRCTEQVKRLEKSTVQCVF